MGKEGEYYREHHASQQGEVTSRLAVDRLDADSERSLTTWVAGNAEWLPLLGAQASLIGEIERMELSERGEYLQQLPRDMLLDSDEQTQWEQLDAQFQDAARALVAFWKRQRDL